MTTTFIVTVDVETRTRGDSSHDILGVIPGIEETFGVEKIMDLLEVHGARGTFFLNVYEIAKRGDAVMMTVARMIHERGHDLELHTHPRPMFGCYGMSQASLGEQQAILERGMSLIETWTGKNVTAHRAGAFAANTDTLRAAAAVGLRVDCSLSPGSRVDVPLLAELGASNAARRACNVWEIPATCFDQIRVGPWRSRRILDIEGCTFPEIKRVVRWAVQNRVQTVSILMHSFSLTRKGKPNHRVLRRLSTLLAWLRERDDVEIGTVERACHRLDAEPMLVSTDAIPATGIWLTWCRAATSWNDGWKNFLAFITGAAVLAMAALGIFFLGYLVVLR